MGKSRLLRRRTERLGQKTNASPENKKGAEGFSAGETKPKEKLGLEKAYARFFEKNYKNLMIIPIIILILALGVIAYQISTTGDFIQKGVSLKEGITITIPSEKEFDTSELKAMLISKFPNADVDIKTYSDLGRPKGIIIQASDIDPDNEVAEQKLLDAIEPEIPNAREVFSSRKVGSDLGNSFFQQTGLLMIAAFIFMGLVVFLYFKESIPSAAVMLAAFSDIVGTIAVTNLLGIKITTAGVAAFLMLIGYSVDTDILLSTRVLKRKAGTVAERIAGSVKTGGMMGLTTICSAIVALMFSQSEILTQIMSIILIGLILDLFNTWFQNAGILMLYMKRKERKHNQKYGLK
ncbi:MAG: hypothetical protein V1659_01420 [Candidatus Woesearchaeota archaeon]